MGHYGIKHDKVQYVLHTDIFVCCIRIAKLVKCSVWHTVFVELEFDFNSWTPSVDQTLEKKVLNLSGKMPEFPWD